MRARRAASVAFVGVVLWALAACASPGHGSLTMLPKGVQSAFPDDGTPEDVVAVERTIARSLTAEVAAFTVRATGRPVYDADRRGVAARIGAGAADGGSHRARRRRRPGDAATEDEGGIRPRPLAGRGDQRRPGEGLRHRSQQVHAPAADTQTRDQDRQYQVLLIRAAGSPTGWLVVAEKAASDDQG